MKSGIDYFPLDVHVDDKIRLIQAEYGLAGFAVIVKLYQKIYGDNGYYADMSDDTLLLFAAENGISAENVKQILSSALRRGVFDKGIYDKYKILTSHGIQTRYLNAVGRRKNVEIDSSLSLLEYDGKNQNVNISNENVYISNENADISKQIKVNKSKVNNSKLNDNAEAAIIALPLNDGTEFTVTEKDLKTYTDLYPAIDVNQELRNMKGWLISNPKNKKTRQGINRFINGWLSRTQNSSRKKPDDMSHSFNNDEFFKTALADSYKNL